MKVYVCHSDLGGNTPYGTFIEDIRIFSNLADAKKYSEENQLYIEEFEVIE